MSDQHIQFVSLVDAMLERRPIPEMPPEPIIEDDETEVSETLELVKKVQPQRAAGEVDSAPVVRRDQTSQNQRRKGRRGRKGSGRPGHETGTPQNGKRRRSAEPEQSRAPKKSGTHARRSDGEVGENDRPNRRRRRRRGGGGQNKPESGGPKTQN